MPLRFVKSDRENTKFELLDDDQLRYFIVGRIKKCSERNLTALKFTPNLKYNEKLKTTPKLDMVTSIKPNLY